MVTTTIRTLRSGRLPKARRERAQVVLIGQARQAGEDIFQVGERIFAVALAGDDQRVEDRRALSCGASRP